MRWFGRRRAVRTDGPILAVERLDVYYGRAHALQEVSLSLSRGVTAVVGRNGMGKTTLCNAITGLVPASGSVRLAGEEILGLPPNAITARGVGYVPQGRRVWPSLTVDEHLRLAARERAGWRGADHRGRAAVVGGARSLSGADHRGGEAIVGDAHSVGARSLRWTVARVYETFPRLAERKGHGGAELSGGEQQMLAIARALLFNPILLVMDEPTEGLAPVIVRQVADMLKRLAADGEISVLLIEQNLGVAIEVADTVDVMVNGRIARSMPAAELGADRDLQQRLLGVRVGGDEPAGEELDAVDSPTAPRPDADVVTVYTVRRGGDEGALAPPIADAPVERAAQGFTRWNAADPTMATRAAIDGFAAPMGRAPGSTRAGSDDATSPVVRADQSARADHDRTAPPAARTGETARAGSDRAPSPMGRAAEVARGAGARVPEGTRGGDRAAVGSRVLADSGGDRGVGIPGSAGAPRVQLSVAATVDRAAYVAGTFDTKARELFYVTQCLEQLGLRTVTVDLATSGKPSPAMIHPREVARHHPKGERAVFTGDRGSAVSEMAVAFEHFVARRRDLGGLISAGGSGGTALATAAMRSLPVGVPKVMVSSVASGDVKPYVGPSDICMMYSVTDVAGINRISERVLANAAHALAGMIAYRRPAEASASSKPAIGLTMFGVTTPCVQAVVRALEDRYDCLVFHATGTGGQSMEKLVASGLLAGVIDVTTTEIADEIVGGVLSAGPGRLDAIAEARIPYVGTCGALDMVNFWAMDTVPAAFRGRRLYPHNPNVTLMRTTAEECARIGRFVADKLNRMEGPVRFLIPEGGVSLIDAPGQPFWDPAADRALFDAIGSGFRAGLDRKLVRLPYNVNDPAFSEALVHSFTEIVRAPAARSARGR